MAGGGTSIPKMQPPEAGVTVRMYRTGFGDCFLLAFRGPDGAPVYMLIDCGVHSQYSGGAVHIRQIVDHIRASTDGRLDVVVITHEHADHISGFYAGRQVFENEISVGQVWFAWTEKPGDLAADRFAGARERRKVFDKTLRKRIVDDRDRRCFAKRRRYVASVSTSDLVEKSEKPLDRHFGACFSHRSPSPENYLL